MRSKIQRRHCSHNNTRKVTKGTLQREVCSDCGMPMGKWERVQ